MAACVSTRFCAQVQADTHLLAQLFKRLAQEGIILHRIELMQDIHQSQHYSLALEMTPSPSFAIADYFCEVDEPLN